MIQIRIAPAAAIGVAMVQSGRDRVAIAIRMNATHPTAIMQAAR
jgi:hypothetical protein